MFTIDTLEFLLSKLLKVAQEAHRAPGIINNILTVLVLCDAGCEVFLHSTVCDISFNGVIIL